MIDYIVVGLGLSGISFCQKLISNQKRFVVIDDGKNSASRVGSGLYNPIALKRSKLAWMGHQMMSSMDSYKKLEADLGVNIIHSSPILKTLLSATDVNDWHEACSQVDSKPYMRPKIIKNKNNGIHAPFGFGVVDGTGWIDTAMLVKAYASYLDKQELLMKHSFSADDLEIKGTGVRYDQIEAQHIVFTQGVKGQTNPWFSYLPLQSTKGELLVIESQELQEETIIHGGVFVIPLGNGKYRVGSTYNWKDRSATPTVEARDSLLQKLDCIIKVPYHVLSHSAGFRPTTPDRRPLVGVHPKHHSLAICNGMGSRGVLQAPFTANSLFEFIEKGEDIAAEIDVNRFKRYILDK